MSDVSHLLNVPVFCFLERIQRWQRLAPNNVDRILPESEPGEMAITCIIHMITLMLIAIDRSAVMFTSAIVLYLHTLNILFLFQPQCTPK